MCHWVWLLKFPQGNSELASIKTLGLKWSQKNRKKSRGREVKTKGAKMGRYHGINRSNMEPEETNKNVEKP